MLSINFGHAIFELQAYTLRQEGLKIHNMNWNMLK